MAEVKWIKIVTDIFDNRKMRQIETMPEGDSILVVWFKLICLAGSINDNGRIYLTENIPYTEEMLANQFNRPLATVRLALKVFEEFGMVEIVDNFLLLPAWEKYQSVEKLEKIREQTRKRVAAHREKQRLVGSVTSNANVTQCNATEEEKEEEVEVEEEKENVSQAKPRKRFIPPTLEEVRSYCQERKNNVDAQRFIDYYTANGWMVGKNKMKDWRAAVRNWERNSKPSIAVKQNASDDLDGIF
jgi:predicted phage replisome organizer